MSPENSESQNKSGLNKKESEGENSLLTYGAQLSAERQRLGLSVVQVAVELNVKATVINAIEQQDYHERLSNVFIKGYIRSYGAMLNLCSVTLIELYEQDRQPCNVNTMQSFSRKVEQQNTDKRINYVSLLIALAVIASLTFWWVQQADRSGALANKNLELRVAHNTNAISVTDEGPVIKDIPFSNKAAIITDEKQLGETLVLTDESNTPVVNEKSKVLVETVNGTDNQPVTLDSEALREASVVLRFFGDCWMELVDAKGDRIAFGTKQAGKVISVSGMPPFILTLGAPEMVSVQYSGELVNMVGYRPGRTARITLPEQKS